jgi:hypothetical protein
MKFHSLLLPLIAIGSAIVPILSMSLPAQSEPSKANIAIAQQEVDEVIDFGIRLINPSQPQKKPEPLKIDVKVPFGHRKFVVTPSNPFILNTQNGQIDAFRHGEILASINTSGLSLGRHQKVVTILTEKKLIIKRVLLKVQIVALPSLPTLDPSTKP